MNVDREIITIERNGKKYSAYYKIEKGYVTVYGNLDCKTTQLGGLDREGAKGLAELLMSELITEGKITPK